jgi:hypothetical protein
MAQNARTAMELQTAILAEGDASARALLAHWQDPNDATAPGRIVVVHGLKRYPYSLSAGPMPWDNQDFCWYQDMVDNSPRGCPLLFPP